MGNYLYIVKIGKNDIFVFTNHSLAVEFCKENTTWSNSDILNKAQKIVRKKDKSFYKISI